MANINKPDTCISAKSLSLLQIASNTLFSLATTETCTISVFDLTRAAQSYKHTAYYLHPLKKHKTHSTLP